MKKIVCLSLLVCLLSTTFFAQTNEEIKEEVKIEMKNLKKDMENLQKELESTFDNLDLNFDFDFDNFDIDLSALDALQDIDWEEHIENEKDRAYFESGQFAEDMKHVQEEVDQAMEEVKIEMKKLEHINSVEIQKIIQDAMDEVNEELKKIDKDN